MIPADRLQAAQLRIRLGVGDQRIERGVILLRENKTRALSIFAMERAPVEDPDPVAASRAEEHTADFHAAMPNTVEPLDAVRTDFVQNPARVFDHGRVAVHRP